MNKQKIDHMEMMKWSSPPLIFSISNIIVDLNYFFKK